jgi:hypothetical protein
MFYFWEFTVSVVSEVSVKYSENPYDRDKLFDLPRYVIDVSGTYKKLLPNGEVVEIIYQRVKPGLGNIKYIASKDLQGKIKPTAVKYSNTPLQEAHRLRFKNAVLSWHGLTENEKNEWRLKAKAANISGFNLYVKSAFSS